MKFDYQEKYDFQDVLIRPKRSTLSSRSEVSLDRTIKFKHSGREWTGLPILVANMDTTGTFEMARELTKHKMITCIHKHYKVEEYPEDLDRNHYAISTGITENDWDKLVQLIDKLDPYFLCIDVANGYMKKLVEFTKKVRDNYPKITIFCGNVVTREMVEELVINGGVDVVKVGIGSGSVCTTRLQTGVGMPQLSANIECSDAAHGINAQIISDGGIVHPGDISKAFGSGADFVMMGSMFAGHTESGGELVTDEKGEKYKIFYGMSSSNAMNKHYGSVAKYRSSEGKAIKMKYKGDVENTILNLLGGIRSTCTYIGAHRLKDIPKCTTFMVVRHQVNTVHNGKEI